MQKHRDNNKKLKFKNQENRYFGIIASRIFLNHLIYIYKTKLVM